MSTLPTVELGVLGPLQVRQGGATVAIPGTKPRAILTLLGLHCGSVVSADTLVELLWGDDPPRTAAKALQTHISSLRRTLGDGFVLTEGSGWILGAAEVDASRYKLAAKIGRDAAAAGDTSQAVARFEQAVALWRGTPELPDGKRGASEKTRWIEAHAALVEDRADALLAMGRAAEIIGELEAAVAEAPLRERRWGQLMLALYRAGRQGDALGAYQRARSLLADELGVYPGPDLRRLEALIVAQDVALEMPVSQQLSSVTRAVTFLLTDIEGSTAAWEADADAMAVALARHDEIVEQVVTSRGGRLIKTRGEGDATFSVFDRPSAAAAAAIELQEAIIHEPWALREPMRIRVALHTGEAELRDGDYFGRAVNRAARLRSLTAGGQILCSGATAELVIDTLPDDVVLADLGMRQLKNLARPEHAFELRLDTGDDSRAPSTDAPMERPEVPAVLVGPGPFVGRGRELERLLSTWQTTLATGTSAVLIAGEPGVGKTRLAGEWSRQAYEQGAVVLYGRSDEDLGAPYQPFAEALRSLVPCLGANRLRGLRGVEALLPLVPGLTDVLPDLAAPPRADPDTERYALFDAVVALLGVASASAPVVLILDDLHWAAKPTLLLLRHLLRFGEHARVQIVGTYRSTDLDRSHPLAAMLADLHRDGSANRLALSGLDEDDVTAYVAEAGYDDEELARALALVTGGNPFFLIEALRHVDESGGHWDPSTLPQGVREAVSRRLSRLPAETNKGLAAAAVVGSRFALDLVERVVGDDLVDAFDEACKAGIVIEEPGGRYRFNHAIVRQSLLAELASVRRMRLHQRIAATLETEPGVDDELLAELAYHYFECAWAGNAGKAVEYCRRAADQAMARLAYEGAADLYDKALHALEELDDELADRDDQQAELLVARCEALLAAGDVVSAAGAVSQLQEVAGDSARLTAWGTCFDGQLSMLTHPERLDEIESAVAAAAEKLAGLGDAAGEAKAHTVRATCLGRLGRIGDAETALDQALTAARRAGEHRRVNNVLANAPLAALWGPNPVPRAGGRCLDVVRLLRITTGSPVVEATSTRCQGVLDAFRGRAAAGRQLIDSARRSLTELGMRHALLEVDQFAGIVELVADDPASAEPHLRRAFDGFRRMGLDADTAETAALLARACLALGRDAEADELCSESERLAGHALKASIAWRTVRAELLARGGARDEARRTAEEAVALAERTDALVDHGDACMALATVLEAVGDSGGAQAAAERAVDLYERKGAAALANKARRILGERELPAAPAAPETPVIEPENACARAVTHLDAAVRREAWDELEQLFATDIAVESRRKIVGFHRVEHRSGEHIRETQRYREQFPGRGRRIVIAVRGERLALTRLEIRAADVTAGAPQDEMLQLFGLDDDGRIALQVWFDLDDTDAAIAELDSMHARFEGQPPRPPLENAASRVEDQCYALFNDDRPDEIGALLADNHVNEDRRQGLRRETNDRATAIENIRAIAALGVTITNTPVALREDRLCLSHVLFERRETQTEAFSVETLELTEIDTDGLMAAKVVFDPDDLDAAFAELDARYLAGEAAAHAHTWSLVAKAAAAVHRREIPPTTSHWVNIDHRRGIAFEPGAAIANIRAWWDLTSDAEIYLEAVHRLSNIGAVVSFSASGISQEGFDAEWRLVELLTFQGDLINRCEIFDEANLGAALAKFDELSRPAPRLENAASRADARLNELCADRRWDEFDSVITDDIRVQDRRIGLRSEHHGRASFLAEAHTIGDLGTESVTSDVLAIRGECLALVRVLFLGRDKRPDAFRTEMLRVVEVDADDRILAYVVFDLDDIDAAFEELDARYVAGEAAPYSRTWSVIAGAFVAHNRRELPATTPVGVDHRRVTAFGPGEGIEYIRAGWDLGQDIKVYIETVCGMNHLGAVFTWAGHGSSQEGFDAEWRGVELMTVDGNLINLVELFDESHLDAALARLDELSPPAPRLENAANRAYERVQRSFAAHDWSAMAELLADEFLSDDRRRVVNAGILGKDAAIEDLRANADLGVTLATSSVVATRGERLMLGCARYTSSAQGMEAFHADVLNIIESDADERVAARVIFDPDDIDAAIAELDARYTACEAADHAHTWSVIAEIYAGLNRHKLPATTPDWVNVDHRHVTTIAPGDLIANLRVAWDLTPQAGIYIAAVHRLSDLGAVVTHSLSGTSQEGFFAEWRMVNLVTFEGDLMNRSELFDETDLEAALARFDELNRRAPQLENAASQLAERFCAYFAARDWTAMAEVLAQNVSVDDRRRVVGAGVRLGREAEIENLRAWADLNITDFTSELIAIRGGRLALCRARWSRPDQRPEAFHGEALGVIEINANNQIAVRVMFDPDDIDAAFEELDARYLAGEAAAHAHTWSVVARAYAALGRHELPATTRDWVNVDHRPLAMIEAGDLTASIRAGWALTPDFRTHIEFVHRLSELGAVVTHAAYGTSQQGFYAESRGVSLLTVEGDLISRCELFDEADIDAAIARFEELCRPASRLKNAARQAYERFRAYFAARDWEAIGAMLADDVAGDDRRRVVNAEVRRGKDAALASARAAADLGASEIAIAVIAIRGSRLALLRVRYSGQDQRPEAFHTEELCVLAVDAQDSIAANVAFDLDDFDAAFEELDARYVAGEAAAHSHTWSVITRAHAAFNRRELPAMAPNLIDHRPLVTLAPGDPTAKVRDMWEFTPDLRIYIEAVHRLSDLGAVFTQVSHGTSQEGFDAEWRIVELVTIDGDSQDRAELFDEAQLDAALARFDELNRPASQLENAASRTYERYRQYFAARDWSAMAELLTEDTSVDDHRRVVNAEPRRGREAEIENMRAVADIGVQKISATVMATRGERLALCRSCMSNEAQRPGAFRIEFLSVVEINAHEQIVARVAFDPDDIKYAVEELDARYLAGEAAGHSHMWSVIARAYAAMNRHELPAATAEWQTVDHRKGIAFASSDLTAIIRSEWDVAPDATNYIEAMHRLSDSGAVFTHASHGTSPDGFGAEWRMIVLLTGEGEIANRAELFDETDIDAALVRFDELNRPAAQLENAALRVYERLQTYFAARDWNAIANLLADDHHSDDRRRVVNEGVRHTREAEIAGMRAIADVGITNVSWVGIATRGDRLALTRPRATTSGPGAFDGEVLRIIEIDANERLVARIAFDLDDIDAAFKELDARYVAGEAAVHAHTWSLIVQTYATLNRHELPTTSPNWVNLDHRRAIAFAHGDAIAYIRASWDLTPDLTMRIEAVHMLSNLGAVVTHAAHGTTEEGFDAEWRDVSLWTFEGDEINRFEVFDKADLDVARATFDELNVPAPQLENAATRAWARQIDALNRRDVDGFLAGITADGRLDDRRKVLRAVMEGPERQKAFRELFTLPSSWRLEMETIAVRGSRLSLTHEKSCDTEDVDGPITVELLTVVELGDGDLMHDTVSFDPDDIDAAFEELDTRYLAGEAAEHAHTWSVITKIYAAFTRHELSAMTPDWVSIDHRRGIASPPGDLFALTRAAWEVTPDLSIYIAAVHRLSDIGAVVTAPASGTSQQGFHAEWRDIHLLMFEGDAISRCEIFDEADLDAALARFDELSAAVPQLENAATRTWARLADAFNRRDVKGLLALADADGRVDDRRKGLRAFHEGLERLDAGRALVEATPESWRLTIDAVAIRGSRLSLIRQTFRDTDETDSPITLETLVVTEVNDDGRVRDTVLFDPDDINGAFAELTARWIASGEVAHPEVIGAGHWLVEAYNRHDWDGLAQRSAAATYVNHRQLGIGGAGTMTDYMSSIRTMASLVPDLWIEPTEIVSYSAVGFVAQGIWKGTSTEGVEIEVPQVMLALLDDDRFTHIEVFDPDQRDLALARFQELNQA